MSFLEKIKNQGEPQNDAFQNPPSDLWKEKEGSGTQAAEGDRWLPESEGQLAVDVYQTENEIVICSTVAGVKPEDLDISIENDMVSIRGRREKSEEVPPENYFCQECYFGPFSRSVVLPVEVDAEKGEAGIKEGILTVRVPKLKKDKAKKIEVKLT